MQRIDGVLVYAAQKNKNMVTLRRASVAAALVLLCACFGEGGASVTGHVLNKAGQPLAGVSVKIGMSEPMYASRPVLPGTHVVTASDGCFDVWFRHGAREEQLRFTATGEGLRKFERTFPSGTYVGDVVLADVKSGLQSTAVFRESAHRKEVSPCVR